MVIRTVRPDDVPDVSAYLNALEKIPPAQRTGTVAVPGLTGVADPAKPVTAVFYPGSEGPRQDTPANPAP
jgi:hypothetical protein